MFLGFLVDECEAGVGLLPFEHLPVAEINYPTNQPSFLQVVAQFLRRD
jgi:hypothetical protein